MNDRATLVAHALGVAIDDVQIQPTTWGDHIRAVVDTTDGIRLWVKERPSYLTGREFAAIRNTTLLLYRLGAPVPAPPLNHPPLFEANGRLFLVERYSGDPALRSPLHPTIGAAFARFHNTAAAVRTWRRRRHRRPLLSPLHHSDTPARLLYRLRTLTHSSDGRSIRREALQTLHWLDEILSPWSTMPQPRSQWIHGDAAPENCVLSADTVTLVDFDDSRWGEPEWDLIQYVFRSCSTPEQVERGASLSSIADFLAAYQEHRSLRAERLLELCPLVVASTTAMDMDLLPETAIGADDWRRYRLTAERGNAVMRSVLAAALAGTRG